MSSFNTSLLGWAKTLKGRKCRPAKGNIRSYLDRLNLCENGRSAYLEPAAGAIADEKIIAHSYWYGEFGRKQAFCLKSFLATQDRERLELWLWLDEAAGYDNYEANPWLQPLLPYIATRPYNPEKAIAGSPFERTKRVFCQQEWLPGRADAFRIWALSQYGGFYFDIDTVFLRDIGDLLSGDEFVTAWERQRYANNAFLYLRKNSFLTAEIVKKAVKNRCFHPWFLFDYENSYMRYLKVYPCCYFDPLWLGYAEGMSIRGFEGLFADKESAASGAECGTYQDFFKGSYAFHWHNQWDRDISDTSYFAQFEREFESRL